MENVDQLVALRQSVDKIKRETLPRVQARQRLYEQVRKCEFHRRCMRTTESEAVANDCVDSRKLGRTRLESRPVSENDLMQAAKSLFDEIDHDGNNELDVSELLTALGVTPATAVATPAGMPEIIRRASSERTLNREPRVVVLLGRSCA